MIKKKQIKEAKINKLARHLSKQSATILKWKFIYGIS